MPSQRSLAFWAEKARTWVATEYSQLATWSKARWDAARAQSREKGARSVQLFNNPGLRAVVSVASLIAVAVVPGAAMAAGAITVAAGAYCSYGSFCLYSEPNFTGRKVEYSADRLFCQGSIPALDVRSVLPEGARSVANNTRTATSALGVKIYSSPGHLVLTTVSPGSQVSELDQETARAMQSLCAFPKN